jgi:hypothetical protein
MHGFRYHGLGVQVGFKSKYWQEFQVGAFKEEGSEKW